MVIYIPCKSPQLVTDSSVTLDGGEGGGGGGDGGGGGGTLIIASESEFHRCC